MMKPTDEQLRDPKWWDENLEQWAVLAAVETDARGGFVTIQQRASEKHNGFVISHPDNDLKVYKRPIKPAAPEWNGEGLPPVGCECEHRGSGGHESVKVLAHAYKRTTGKVVVFQKQDDSITYSSPEFFRPIRTKEQRERDELVETLQSAQEQRRAGGPRSPAEVQADAILSRYNLEPKL